MNASGSVCFVTCAGNRLPQMLFGHFRLCRDFLAQTLSEIFLPNSTYWHSEAGAGRWSRINISIEMPEVSEEAF